MSLLVGKLTGAVNKKSAEKEGRNLEEEKKMVVKLVKTQHLE